LTTIITPRRTWGARHVEGDGLLSGQATGIAIHHTAGGTLSVNASVEAELNQMRLLEQVGQNRFRRGISYHVVIFPSGRAYQGLAFNRRGTHVGGHNTALRGIAFAGNFERYQPTPQALVTAAQVIAQGRGVHWRANASVDEHRRWTATQCAGRNIRPHIPGLRSTAITVAPIPKPAQVQAATVLKRGKAGARVHSLQTQLHRVFPSYENAPAVIAAVGRGSRARLISGTFGPVTEAWVKEFQRRVGIAVTGQVGPITGARFMAHGIRGLGW
jgi:peptidoglycan hydrolase-like protein with peptidoglycan-binding domain